MKSDYMFLFVVPIVLGAVLALFRQKPALISVGIVLGMAALYSPFYFNMLSIPNTRKCIAVGLFIWFPFLLNLALSRFQIFYRYPLILLCSVPLLHFVAYVLAVNAWLAMGYGI